MNEQEQGRIDRDAGDGGDRGGDSGLVQPPESHTYRGPYGEPIVVPIADDPEGHPEYQPGHSDAAAARPAHDRLDAIPSHSDDNRRDGFPDHYDADRIRALDCLSYGIQYHFDRDLRCVIDSISLVSDPGSGESDHGPSERRDG